MSKKWADENPEKVREMKRRWNSGHKEKILECVAKYRKNHPEKLKESQHRYIMKYPERLKARTSLYGHRRKGFDTKITPKELENMLIAAIACPQCGLPFKEPRLKTVDRIDNNKIMTTQSTQIICLKCNIKNAFEAKKHLKEELWKL
jgi:hypothetical protein